MTITTLRDRLIAVARERAWTDYTDLAGGAGGARMLAGPLTELMAREHEHDRPLLSVLCVKRRGGWPGDGFFAWVEKHDGGQVRCTCGRPLRRVGESRRDFYLREAELVWEFWHSDGPAGPVTNDA